MERYFPVVKSSYARKAHTDVKKSSLAQSQTASSSKTIPKDERESPGPSGSDAIPDFRHASRSDLNRMLLKSLGKEANPITHSDIAERSGTQAACRISTSVDITIPLDFVQSMKGHQRSEDRANRRLYTNEREAKLKVQPKSVPALKSETQVFRNVRIYINGYLEGTTDIEVKQIVTEGGGTVVFVTPSQSTQCFSDFGF